MEKAKAITASDIVDIYDDEEEDAQKDKYLTFNIGDEDYGLEIQYVIEIVVIQAITQVPDMPEYIKGVINLRGEVISVMDMRSRFGMTPREYDARTCIIVVNVNDLRIGLIVDMVKEVVDIPISQIDAPPRTHSGIQSSYIEGMGKVDNQVKILLKVEKILYEGDLELRQQLPA